MKSNAAQSVFLTQSGDKHNEFSSLSRAIHQDIHEHLTTPRETVFSKAHTKMMSASAIDNRTLNRDTESMFLNGRNKADARVNYETYYCHKERIPEHYHPLLQYLDTTELKFANDNLYNNSPHGFPTRAFVLREKSTHLPILKDTLAERARYKRKLEEKNKNIALTCKKFDFKTLDGHSSHYFLTGARFNRSDTVDSKILNTYGIFIRRNNPELVYFKSGSKPDFFQDVSNNSALTQYVSLIERNNKPNQVYDMTSEYDTDTELLRESSSFYNGNKTYRNRSIQVQPDKPRNKIAIENADTA